MGSRSFDDMDRMFEQMDRMLEGMWGRVSDREAGLAPWSHRAAFDLHEREDGAGYTLVVDLPGFEKDEIEIRATETQIHVDASHEESEEHSYGRRDVSEVFTIPAEVTLDDISASYHNGVLELDLPVDEDRSTGTRIDIE